MRTEKVEVKIDNYVLKKTKSNCSVVSPLIVTQSSLIELFLLTRINLFLYHQLKRTPKLIIILVGTRRLKQMRDLE